MKGIVLAGGSGTRLYPMTCSVSKQLLPIYDKPMIYYPVSVLMLAGITEILLISTPESIGSYKKLFGDGSDIGLNIEYKVQEKPRGLADAFILGKEFIGKDSVCLILGDNVFYGKGFSGILQSVVRYFSHQNHTSLFENIVEGRTERSQVKATIFAYNVKNPSDFGVVEFSKDGFAVSIEEKPIKPKSHFAIPGLYFYDNSVIEVAQQVKPSLRGELEISSVNQFYLENNSLKVEMLGRGFAWLDTGTSEGMLEASNFVRSIQNRQGYYIACLEEIALKLGFISKEKFISLVTKYKNTEYGRYLEDILSEV